MGIEYLKEIKKKKKMSNEKIASASGIPKITVQRFFAGNCNNPSFAYVKAICDVLEADISLYATPDSLIEKTKKAKEQKKQCEAVATELPEYDLVCMYRNLDSMGRILVSRYINDLSEMQAATNS